MKVNEFQKEHFDADDIPGILRMLVHLNEAESVEMSKDGHMLGKVSVTSIHGLTRDGLRVLADLLHVKI